MNKSELKNGAIVETRDKNRYIKVDNTLLNLDMSGRFLNLNDYTDGLLHNSLHRYARIFDIVKVNNNVEDSYHKGICNNAVSEVYFEKKWTWKRNNPLLTDEEKIYLKNIITPFKEKVKAIMKFEDDLGEREYLYITIIANDNNGEVEEILFPYFPKNKYYKNMKIGKEYSLEELKLI